MKKIKTGLNYTIRKLVQIKEVQNIVRFLYENRHSKDEVEIFLPLVNNCVNATIKKAAVNMDNFNLDPCYSLEDFTFLKELEVSKVISIKDLCDRDESGDYTRSGGDDLALVTIGKPKFIETLCGWVNDLPHILSYGPFSLDTTTGEAYCMDKQYNFRTNGGEFEVLKAFLEASNKSLSFVEIYKLSHPDEQLEDEKDISQQAVHQMIGDIRDRLSMKGKLSKLFLPSSKRYFLKLV